MSTEKRPIIKVKIKINDEEMKFLSFKNYIIAISYHSNKITFYDMNNSLKVDFTIEFKQDKFYEHWKLYYSKKKELFLIGSWQTIFKYKNLGIFLLNIEKRTVDEKISYNFIDFIEVKKEDKLFIINDKSIIAYDFNSNLYEKKIERNNHENYKLFFVDDYLLIYDVEEIFPALIIDKNLEKIVELNSSFHFLYSSYFLDSNSFNKAFQPILDNRFYIYYNNYIDESYTYIEFLDIKLKGKEDKLKKMNNINEENGDDLLDWFDSYIIIKTKKNISLNTLKDKKFLLNCGNNDFYVCDSNNLEIITKIELNPLLNDLVDYGELLLFKMKGIYYEMYFYDCNKKELLYISNK